MKIKTFIFINSVALMYVVTAFAAPDTSDAGLPAAAPYAQESGAGKSIEVLIETDGKNFKGISRKVRNRKAPEFYRQVMRPGFYYIEAVDASGRAMRVQSMPDPTEVFYDYFDLPLSTGSASSGPQAGQEILLKGGRIKLPKAQFLLRLPYDADISALKIHSIKDSLVPATKERRMVGSHASQAPAPAERELKATLDLGTIPEAP